MRYLEGVLSRGQVRLGITEVLSHRKAQVHQLDRWLRLLGRELRPIIFEGIADGIAGRVCGALTSRVALDSYV